MAMIQKRYTVVRVIPGLCRGDLCGENSDQKSHSDYVLMDADQCPHWLRIMSVNGIPCFITLDDNQLLNPSCIWLVAKTTDCANTVYDCEPTANGTHYMFIVSHDMTTLEVRTHYVDPLD